MTKLSKEMKWIIEDFEGSMIYSRDHAYIKISEDLSNNRSAQKIAEDAVDMVFEGAYDSFASSINMLINNPNILINKDAK